MTNVIVADDDKYICKSVKFSILKFFPNFKIICVSDGIEVLKIIEEVPFSLMILDVDMPLKGGLQTAKEVLQKFPEAKIILMSSYKSPLELMSLKINGVVGFIRKGCKDFEYKEAIESVLSNKLYFAPEILLLFAEKNIMNRQNRNSKTIHDYHLSESEFIVLRHIIENNSNQDIATILSLELKTIEKHLTNIYKKLLGDSADKSSKKRDVLKQLGFVKNWYKNLN